MTTDKPSETPLTALETYKQALNDNYKHIADLERRVGVLSMDVDCPWCIAKAGEPCWDWNPKNDKGGFRRTDGEVHLARVKLPDAILEANMTDQSKSQLKRLEIQGEVPIAQWLDDIANYLDKSGPASKKLREAADTIRARDERIGQLQAEIDRLMLEYCPDEMTPGQIQEWGENQVVGGNQDLPIISDTRKALTAEGKP